MPRVLLSALTAALAVLVAKLGLEAAVQPSFPVHPSGVVLVTGASSGIGEHAAATLVARGKYTVFAGVRRQEDAKRLQQAYPGIRPIFLDVTDEESIRSAVDILKDSGMPLVGLVNNAGVQRDLPLELQKSKDERFTFNVNVFGMLDVTRAFLPLLRKAGAGARVVTVGSVSGVIAAPGSSTYSASKFAIEGITDSLRMELQPFGISVSLIQPGYVRSKMGSKFHESSSDFYGVSDAQYNLYKHVFEGFFVEDRLNSLPENAAPPESTSSLAITHALTATRPKTRYACANVGPGLPAWVVVSLKSILPDRVMDLLLV